MIDNFSGKYAFLSNFYEIPLVIYGLRFLNSEAAYQSQKCLNPEHVKGFQNLTANSAKRKGRSVPIKPNWNQIKEEVMWEVLQAKFNQNSELIKLLLETRNEELIEGNTWGDTYWGVCNGVGKNRLGVMLMYLRDAYKGRFE
jgi:ribA/ribD-fused uncharacterized protein